MAKTGRWGSAPLCGDGQPIPASSAWGPQSSRRVTLRDRHPVHQPARSSFPGVKIAAPSTRVKNAVPGRTEMWPTASRLAAKEHPLPASRSPLGAERLPGELERARARTRSLPAPRSPCPGGCSTRGSPAWRQSAPLTFVTVIQKAGGGAGRGRRQAAGPGWGPRAREAAG